jgi:hypothetical protein
MANKVWTFELPGKWSDAPPTTHTVELRQNRWSWNRQIWVDGRQMRKQEMRSCTATDFEEEYVNYVFEINGHTCWVHTRRSGFHDLAVDGLSMRTGEQVPKPDLETLCPPWFSTKRVAVFLMTFSSAGLAASLMQVSYPAVLFALLAGYFSGGRIATWIEARLDGSEPNFLRQVLLAVGSTILASITISPCCSIAAMISSC